MKSEGSLKEGSGLGGQQCKLDWWLEDRKQVRVKDGVDANDGAFRDMETTVRGVTVVLGRARGTEVQ